jgi:hypothetical protein
MSAPPVDRRSTMPRRPEPAAHSCPGGRLLGTYRSIRAAGCALRQVPPDIQLPAAHGHVHHCRHSPAARRGTLLQGALQRPDHELLPTTLPECGDRRGAREIPAPGAPEHLQHTSARQKRRASSALQYGPVIRCPAGRGPSKPPDEPHTAVVHAWQNCRTGSALALPQPAKTMMWSAGAAIHSVIDNSHQLGGAGDRRCNSQAHQTRQSL